MKHSVHAKDKSIWRPNLLPRTELADSRYDNPDNDPRGPWSSSDFTISLTGGQRGAQYTKTGESENIYEIVTPSGRKLMPSEGRCWGATPERYNELLSDNRLWFGETGNNVPRLKRFLSEVQAGIVSMTIWLRDEVGDNQDSKREIKALLDSGLFSTPKPERLLQRILHIGSNEGDLVLDFFAGSGTTGAVALKMGRRFVLVEQMDYLETTTIPRLQKVIAGEQGGISQDVGWQGGGDFVACELLQWNERYVQRIQAAASAAELWDIWQEMQSHGFISYRVDVAAVNANAADFAALALDEQKRFLLETLDHNALYVNLSEMDDADYAVSDADKRLNAQFYGREA